MLARVRLAGQEMLITTIGLLPDACRPGTHSNKRTLAASARRYGETAAEQGLDAGVDRISH
jgi:hypothetical protein